MITQEKIDISNKNNDYLKQIIKIDDKDIASDNVHDTVDIYLKNDLDVVLKVKENLISVLTGVREEQVFGSVKKKKGYKNKEKIISCYFNNSKSSNMYYWMQ